MTTVAGSADQAAPGISWIDWQGSGPVLHLAHANGFPPETYRRLATTLAKGGFHAVSMTARPLWQGARSRALRSWDELADDLAAELTDRQLMGVVGVGHSLGGVITLLAAARYPGLFRAVVAIDPVLFVGSRAFLWGLMRRFGTISAFPLVRNTRRRRTGWPDRKSMREWASGRELFAGWEPEVLEDYLEAAFVEQPSGEFELRYPRAWEARIFELAPHDRWRTLRRVRVPVLLLRGADSHAFTHEAAKRAIRELPDVILETIPETGHLLPMQKPDAVATAALGWLDNLSERR